MTDRVKALTVVLDKDVRIDDVEALMDAIKMLKGVRKVTPEVANVADHVADMRARGEVVEKLLTLIDELRK